LGCLETVLALMGQSRKMSMHTCDRTVSSSSRYFLILSRSWRFCSSVRIRVVRAMPCCDPPCWQSSNQSTFCIGSRVVRASYIGHVFSPLSWRLRLIVARRCCMTSGDKLPASHRLGTLLPSVSPLYFRGPQCYPVPHNVNLTNQGLQCCVAQGVAYR